MTKEREEFVEAAYNAALRHGTACTVSVDGKFQQGYNYTDSQIDISISATGGYLLATRKMGNVKLCQRNMAGYVTHFTDQFQEILQYVKNLAESAVVGGGAKNIGFSGKGKKSI